MKSGLMALLLLWLGTGHAQTDNAPLVAVASSLRQVWPHLMAEYQHPQKPRVTFGSSGNLARQITQGAPFKLLLSADQSFPEWLVENGTTNYSPVTYAQGRLAWVALANSSLAKALTHANSLEQPTVLFPSDVKRLTIANPAFAPYGRAAKAVLKSIDDDESISLALGENAAQALQFALSGATGGGIVPLALVGQTARQNLPDIVVSEIPARQHDPLLHTMVLITKPAASTQALFDFLVSDTAQAVFVKHGFSAAQ